MAYTAFSVSQSEVPNAAKWNTLASNDAHFNTFLGMDLAWTSWTPTWTGITKGGATVLAYYTRIGNTVFCRLKFSFGSGTVMTTTPTFTLPVTANSVYASRLTVMGTCYVEDYSTAAYWGTVRSATDATKADIIIANSASTYITNAAITTTVPFTWTTNDYFETNFFYEAA